MIAKLIPDNIEKPWAGGHLGNNIGEKILLSSLSDYHVKIESKDGQVLFREFWQQQSDLEFPFMLKLLSLKKPLSIQVHPDEQVLEKLGLSGIGKEEAWYILKAKKTAKAYLGAKNFNEVKNKIANREEVLPTDLVSFSLQENSGYLLTPGLLHATEGEIFLMEIQQPSMHTFRVYDYARGRKLHFEEALMSIKDVQPVPWKKTIIGKTFTVNIYEDSYLEMPAKEIEAWVYLDSPERWEIDSKPYQLHLGDTFLFYKEQSIRLTGTQKKKWLRVY